jgi:hydroxybutyrate-dimer hydrolase
MQGDRTWKSDTHSKLLYDYFSYINIYQPCADLAQPDASLNTAVVFGALELAENRCASMAELGLLTQFHDDGTETTALERAEEARDLINGYGILEEQNWVQPTQQFFEFNEAIAVTYANAYGRFSVIENLCGISFAAADGTLQPAPLPDANLQALFGVSSGVPPTGDIQLINNDSLGGAVRNRFSLSSDGIQDQNLAAALCYRSLFTGLDVNGEKLKGELKDAYKRVRKGLKRIPYKARLKKIPTMIVHGRNDGVVPPNHSSRAYFGVNQITERQSRLYYYEVTNANHLDAFIPFFSGFQERYIPLHYYFDQAMDIMYDHLKNGTPLPPSQVVRTLPRGVSLPDITSNNVPDIAVEPNEGDLITLVKKRGKYTLNIPE